MDENYNLTLIVIVNKQIELSDLFERIRKADLNDFKIEPPTIRTDTSAPGGLTISTAPQGFTFNKVISGYDLMVFNIIHSDAKRGAFKVELQNIGGTSISNQLYKELHDLVQLLGYNDVHAYEISLHFLVNHKKYPAFKEINDLITMDSPHFGSLRILDGYEGKKDIREEFISEIRIEMLLQPMKSQVSTVHRFKDFDPNKLQKIFSDVDRVLSLVKW